MLDNLILKRYKRKTLPDGLLKTLLFARFSSRCRDIAGDEVGSRDWLELSPLSGCKYVEVLLLLLLTVL